MTAKTDKEQIIYEQNCQDFRQLNNVLWQVPVLSMTLTGGILFGISAVQNAPLIQIALWLLLASSNIGFIFVLLRLRKGVMERILDAKREYEGVEAVEGSYTVILIFSLVLGIAAGIGISGLGTGLYNIYKADPNKVISVNRLIAEKNDNGLNVYCE